jgi:probable HAF family extracellular repeat protein
MQNLGLISGKNGYSLGWDMNNLGVVIGASTSGAKLRAFSFNTAMQDLGTLGGNNSQAWGINDLGDIVGTADTTTKASTNKHQAFVRKSGVGMFKLEPQIVNLPGSMNLKVVPWRISNEGQIIGPGRLSPAGTAYVITPQ